VKEVNMTETVSALKARKNLGELLDKAHYNGNSFIIERAGKEIAAIVPLEDYRRLETLKRKNISALKKIWKKIGSDNLKDEDISSAIKSIRSNN
jgi:prevent-host-death family protein